MCNIFFHVLLYYRIFYIRSECMALENGFIESFPMRTGKCKATAVTVWIVASCKKYNLIDFKPWDFRLILLFVYPTKYKNIIIVVAGFNDNYNELTNLQLCIFTQLPHPSRTVLLLKLEYRNHLLHLEMKLFSEFRAHC